MHLDEICEPEADLRLEAVNYYHKSSTLDVAAVRDPHLLNHSLSQKISSI